jgi:glycosyltransferase involved in cell wall biosynthesis
VAKDTPIVLVGPTHPHTGGISQHATRLALELEKAGYDTVVESWKAQYPKRLYPGTATVPDGEPEIGIPSHTTTALAWYSPLSWFLAGRRHRGSRIVVSIPTAFHALPYSVMALGAGKSSEVWGIVHNVTPHDSGRLSRTLMAWLLKKLDRLIVHGEAAKEDAVALGCDPSTVTVTTLPSPWPAITAPPAPADAAGLRALFFGTIRPYKGLDLLLEAVALTPQVSLVVAGEFWEERARYDLLVDRLGLGDRVEIIPGYLPSSQFAPVFAKADILVLPYRSGTGSIVKDVGFRHGLPVIATTVGSIAAGIDHDKTGLLIEPNSVEALTQALQQATDKATRNRWASEVASRQSDEKSHWDAYVNIVTVHTPAT